MNCSRGCMSSCATAAIDRERRSGVAIPKAGGGTRNLGIPSVADRVVQQALVQKMTPIFEPLFADCSFGYRPGRSPHMAMRKVWREINEGNLWILDADLRSYFDKIDQERLVDLMPWYLASDPRSAGGASGDDPEGGAGRGVLRRRLVTVRSGRPGPPPPGTMTWLRGARCTDPEGNCPPL